MCWRLSGRSCSWSFSKTKGRKKRAEGIINEANSSAIISPTGVVSSRSIWRIQPTITLSTFRLSSLRLQQKTIYMSILVSWLQAVTLSSFTCLQKILSIFARFSSSTAAPIWSSQRESWTQSKLESLQWGMSSLTGRSWLSRITNMQLKATGIAETSKSSSS